MSEMIRCKDCQEWDKEKMYCYSDKFVHASDIEDLDDHFVYWNSESYSAGFNTGPNFGCIHGVQKQ